MIPPDKDATIRHAFWSGAFIGFIVGAMYVIVCLILDGALR